MDKIRIAMRGLWLGAALVLSTGAGAADLVVSAAASLTNAFAEVGKAYEKANPGDKVAFNFGASGSLLQQISRGAPVDVFASADLETMDRAAVQNLVRADTRANFVSNKLVVVVPAASKARLTRLDDLLASAEIQRVAIGNPESVPVGRYSKGVLEAAKSWDTLAPKMIFTQNVRQSLDYVARGEVDAGFVYLSDTLAAGSKVKIALEVPTTKPILYPIAVVKGNGQENAARRFVQFVQSDVAQKILAAHGFKAP